MKQTCYSLAGFLFTIFCGALLLGCGDGSGAPQAVPEEELPNALRQAFADAAQPQKELANAAATAFEQQDFPKASASLNQLLADETLGEEQRSLASRCLITANQQVREAAEQQGNEEAARYLRYTETEK